MNYEAKLFDIPFYSIHPEYKPFIGKKYGEYRILIVGESHFIGQNQNNAKYSLDYFDKHWWDGTCEELHEKHKPYYITRNVIDNYKRGIFGKAHGIFSNCIKSFSEVILNESIHNLTLKECDKEKRGKIEYLSFMNFFQMPSLYKGMNFWNSLKKAAGNSDKKACEMWEKAVKESSRVLDGVIDALNPNLVIIVSKSAYHAYKNENARHCHEPNVVSVSHPTCHHWNKKRKDGLCGRDDFESYLRNFIVNKKA